MSLFAAGNGNENSKNCDFADAALIGIQHLAALNWEWANSVRKISVERLRGDISSQGVAREDNAIIDWKNEHEWNIKVWHVTLNLWKMVG